MKCLHCSQSVSILAHARNIFAKTPTCPSCGCAFVRELDYKFVGLVAIPLLVITNGLGSWMGEFSCVPGVVLLLALGFNFKLTPEAGPTPTLFKDASEETA